MAPRLTDRQKVVLAALAADTNAVFAPVQVQKLFFLIDENIASYIGGKKFAFEPYNYGPFDHQVYRELEALAAQELTIVDASVGGQRRYSLSPKGHDIGQEALKELPGPIQAYLAEVSKWIRSLSFPALVGSIYKAYPRMREKSIFVG